MTFNIVMTSTSWRFVGMTIQSVKNHREAPNHWFIDEDQWIS